MGLSCFLVVSFAHDFFFVPPAHPTKPPLHRTDELCGLRYGGIFWGEEREQTLLSHSNVLLAERKKVDLRRGFFYGLDLENKTSWKEKNSSTRVTTADNCRLGVNFLSALNRTTSVELEN